MYEDNYYTARGEITVSCELVGLTPPLLRKAPVAQGIGAIRHCELITKLRSLISFLGSLIFRIYQHLATQTCREYCTGTGIVTILLFYITTFLPLPPPPLQGTSPCPAQPSPYRSSSIPGGIRFKVQYPWGQYFQRAQISSPEWRYRTTTKKGNEPNRLRKFFSYDIIMN